MYTNSAKSTENNFRVTDAKQMAPTKLFSCEARVHAPNTCLRSSATGCQLSEAGNPVKKTGLAPGPNIWLYDKFFVGEQAQLFPACSSHRTRQTTLIYFDAVKII